MKGFVTAPDGWVPPGNYDGCTQWALDKTKPIIQGVQVVMDVAR